jgi:CDP-glycerol glycerophosphotransferase
LRADEAVLFASWDGKYSDSPRAISDELRRRGAPFQHVWVIGEGAGEVPEWVTTVAPGSPQHRARLERTRYLVANDVLRTSFRDRGMTYLQTWHGTPLKRIAFDVASPRFPGSERYYGVDLARDVARWDYLLSPNRFSTEVLRRAFRYAGEVLETGYPRNDLLLAPDRDAVRARVREALGIAGGVRAVLYAPTWRDGDPFELALDLDEVRHGLGEDHVILLRAHGLVAATADVASTAAVRNVTAHQDVRELYLAADALVTDYSSVMFDFAVTRKPMVFFTYDLARYRDDLRGFYFDFEAEAPGPLVATTTELVAALQDLGGIRARYADAYDRFHDRFCHLEDGRAAERVVDAVFGRA